MKWVFAKTAGTIWYKTGYGKAQVALAGKIQIVPDL